jgi:hypothetical protein
MTAGDAKDYCSQLHLPAELVVPAIGASALLISPNTIKILLYRAVFRSFLHSWHTQICQRHVTTHHRILPHENRSTKL